MNNYRVNFINEKGESLTFFIKGNNVEEARAKATKVANKLLPELEFKLKTIVKVNKQ